ncbi:6-phosphogluconolactonase (cycloisomerase 2 family) [Spinactinospora alkalitolerans]|uniref:6-phosphogluconolactonase (Cycloisomerase 2 family) n=1 Tax=Spinactinospora alkalitolerans TaxID=687207 RepID=A0A852TXM9_9ACTN|nr:lactonase family protein [Spinactinospora alkalitolerans]NYE49266.1 6-phosphogluconolactonase (cycloisomerase 2 family) [Spinactinospora alkalitolerans]
MAERRLLWIGTYTPDSDPAGTGSGIHRVRLDLRTGELGDEGVAARTSGPSFLAAHPGGRRVYAVNERAEGGVTGFAATAEGVLEELGAAATGGASPCHLIAHPGGRHVIAANYADGGVSVHPIGPGGAPGERSRLIGHSGGGPDAERQEGPHAHSVGVAPGGRHLLVADLGTDELRCIPFDPRAADPVGEPSIAARLTPGTGPRHLAVHPSGHVHVAGELDSRVHVLRWDAASSTAEPVDEAEATGVTGVDNFPAEVALSAGGDRLYVSNRGADTIATFEVSADGAKLRHLADTSTGGAWPRHFARVADLLVVANQNSGTLTALRIDPATGVPRAAEHHLPLPDPVCVLPAP